MSRFRPNQRNAQPQLSVDLCQLSAMHKRKWTSIASCALIVGGASMVLVGCQSNKALTQPAGPSGALIDFNNAHTPQSLAQSKAFNARVDANTQRYEQLFDQDKFPNTETQAKTRLLKAIRQHLATEHVAVAQANYQAVPYINADSIDADATGLLRTIIELYAFRENKADDYDDYEGYEYDAAEEVEAARAELDQCTDIEADEVCVVEPYAEEEYSVEEYAEEEISAESTSDVLDNGLEYDKEGYNVYGYDRDDYDRDGYDPKGFDADGYDENGYDTEGYDYKGYDKEGYDYNGYDENGYDEYGEYNYSVDDYESEDTGGGILSTLSGLNPKDLLNDYEAMQSAKQKVNKDKTDAGSLSSSGMINLMLGMFHKTPEQAEAANIYQYQHLTFNSVSQYKPKLRQFQSVYSYDYLAPTLSSSVQIPIAFDFDKSNITVDPSAIMPIVAIINPEHTPLPNQMTSHTVNFGLPESITSQLPSAVIYDAAIAAMQDSMAELAPDNFSAIDIRNDSFAKEVGATHAVKIYFSSKQSGEMIGRMLKYMSKSLQQYVDANPEQYPDGAVLKTALDKLQLYNKGYQSADVGALLQLIEAVIPISFNQVNYYYLDDADRLLAKQQRFNFGGDLMGMQTSTLNQIRYDTASFNKHALTPLLTQSFGAAAKPAIDGNAWLEKQKQQENRLKEARYARYDYEESNEDSNASEDISIYESDYDSEYATDAEDVDVESSSNND